MPYKNIKTSIIGAGAVGSVIASLLFDRKISVVSIIDTNKAKARKLAKKLGCKNYSTDISGLSKTTNFLFITTPDDKIHTVTKQIVNESPLNFRNLTVLHTSGVHTSDILSPFKKKGSEILSFHPIQSFPKNFSVKKQKKSFKNIYIGIEGSANGQKTGSYLARLLDCNPVVLDKRTKPLHHIACVFASNYISTLLNAISKLNRRMNGNKNWADVYLPLMRTTIDNSRESGPANSLTGPIERGDHKTVMIHLQSLETYIPELLNLYIRLALDTANLAYQKGSLRVDQYKEFKKIFHKKEIE